VFLVGISMSQPSQILLTDLSLTYIKSILNSLVLQLNTPIVLNYRGVLPMASRKGIITLTLTVERKFYCEKSKSLMVTRGAFVMFNIFRVKTKIQLQCEEYITWKASPGGGNSPFIARDQDEILKAFIKFVNKSSLSEVSLEQIEAYHTKIKREMTPYTTIDHMKAIRAFIRFHKRDTDLEAEEVTNQGVVELQDVGKSDIVVPMKRAKLGRPMNVELVKKVKRLRDKENLSYRQISRALGKNLKSVYLMYHYKFEHVKSWQKDTK